MTHLTANFTLCELACFHSHMTLKVCSPIREIYVWSMCVVENLSRWVL